MARFKYTDKSQNQMIVVNLQEQLLPGTFEWTIDYLINKMDMLLFEQNYHNDELGAAAYSPRVLLKIILYCYSRGILSSRKMERACKDNMIVKALAEDCEPDHDTIATFITTNSEAVKDLFAQVLMQCSQLKLITGEMFAIDGCKLPSNASKEWSGSIAQLRKKRDKLSQYILRLMLQHRDLDKSEEAKKIQEPFRQTMGDDKERRKRGIEQLEKKLKRLNEFLDKAKPKMGTRTEIQSNITDNESARIKGPHGYIQGYNGIAIADSGNQVIVSAGVTGKSESESFPEMLDSLEENMKMATGKKKPLRKALVEGDSGYFSEENLQEAAKRKINVLIPDNQFRQRDPHFAGKKQEKVPKKKRFTLEDFVYKEKEDHYICPAGKILEYKCHVTLRNNSGKQYRPKGGTCISCHLLDKCINRRNKTRENPLRTLYIIDKKYEDNLSVQMRKKIDDPVYRELYSRRMQIIEPVFSNMVYCKGMNRFTVRTLEKVNTQWLLFTIVHNIGKCRMPLFKKYGN
jgi:transposase